MTLEQGINGVDATSQPGSIDRAWPRTQEDRMPLAIHAAGDSMHASYLPTSLLLDKVGVLTPLRLPSN